MLLPVTKNHTIPYFGKMSLSRSKSIVDVIIKRGVTSLAANAAKDNGQVLPFNSIPSPPSYPIIGHLPLLASKKTTEHFDKFATDLGQYGDVVRLKMPGINMVLLYNPDHFHVLSLNEPRIPITPVFDLIANIRKEELPKLYPNSGLIDNSEVIESPLNKKLF